MAEFKLRENSGSIWKNDYKKDGDNLPEYKGKINVDGKVKEIALWLKTSGEKKFFSVKISEPYVKPDTKKEEEPFTPKTEPDDLPF